MDVEIIHARVEIGRRKVKGLVLYRRMQELDEARYYSYIALNPAAVAVGGGGDGNGGDGDGGGGGGGGSSVALEERTY